MKSSHRKKIVALAAIPLFALSAIGCSTGETGPGESTGAPEKIDLVLAHSFGEAHAHHRCGVQVIADRINEQEDLGMNIEVFANSQLGGDIDRVTSVSQGDIDIDLQGPSGLSGSYAPVGMFDTAYAFESPDHIFRFLDGEESQGIKDGLLKELNLRTITGFYFGDRTFSANTPIRTPDDLKGIRIRFPNSPAYLANAESMGAEVVAVAFEELFLALQQGIADGQENPIPTIKDMSLDEVQKFVSLNRHQVGMQLLVFNEDSWKKLSTKQQDAFTKIATEVRAENRACIESDVQTIIDDWKKSGKVTVVEDVDRQAFIDKAEKFWLQKYTGAELELYKTIRNMPKK
ncbi:MAG: TRAP transporter substrate-binding protein DctP [Microbacteriaceae bacterium]